MIHSIDLIMGTSDFPRDMRRPFRPKVKHEDQSGFYLLVTFMAKFLAFNQTFKCELTQQLAIKLARHGVHFGTRSANHLNRPLRMHSTQRTIVPATAAIHVGHTKKAGRVCAICISNGRHRRRYFNSTFATICIHQFEVKICDILIIRAQWSSSALHGMRVLVLCAIETAFMHRQYGCRW